jgi:flagellar hook-length control protein FliK
MTAHHAPNLIGGAGSSNTMGEARLSASPGSPDFGPQLGAQITTFVRDGLEHARLQLHPADMGPVLVQIQLDGQTAQVHLSAEHAVTRQALEAALPQLASQLREAGLTLSGGGVSEQAQQGRQAPSDNPSRPTSTPESTRPEPQEPSRTLLRRGVVDLVA